jgi:hypothetical protein
MEAPDFAAALGTERHGQQPQGSTPLNDPESSNREENR